MSNAARIELDVDVERAEFFSVLGVVLAHVFPRGEVALGPHPDPVSLPREAPLGVSLVTGDPEPLPLVQFWRDDPGRISCEHRAGEVGFWVAYRVLFELRRAFTPWDGEPPRVFDEGAGDEPVSRDWGPEPKTFSQYAPGLAKHPELLEPYASGVLGSYLRE